MVLLLPPTFSLHGVQATRFCDGARRKLRKSGFESRKLDREWLIAKLVPRKSFGSELSFKEVACSSVL